MRPFHSFFRLVALFLPFFFLQLACQNASKQSDEGRSEKDKENETLNADATSSPDSKSKGEKASKKESEKSSSKSDNKDSKRPTTRSMAQGKDERASVPIQPEPGTEAFRERVDQEAEVHRVLAKGDTTLRCSQGTKLHFPPEPFETVNGKAIRSGKVEIQVKEYRKSSEILLADLSTKSGDRPLETGGMVHIDAEADGKDCRLKDGKSMRIAFPRQEGQKDMKLFKGNRNADGEMDWEVASDVDQTATYSRDELDQESMFPGGDASQAGYIREKTPYPAQAQAQGKEGVVRIGAEVSKHGELDNFVLLDSVAPSLNRAAMRTVRDMPNWIPAKKNGQAVRSRTSIDVKFKLGEGFEKEKEPLSPEELEEKMANGDSLGSASQEAVSDYLFQTSDMRGYHNCDRFLEGLNFKEYVVELDEGPDTELKLYFPGGNTYLNAMQDEKSHIFDQVPRNEEVKLIAIKPMDEGYGLAIQEVNTRNEDPELSFEKLNMEKLKEEMKTLNGERG